MNEKSAINYLAILAASFILACTSVNRDNPLDANGDNYMPPPPPTPGMGMIQAVDFSTVRIEWEVVPYTETYELARDINEDGEFNFKRMVDAPPFIDTDNLFPVTRYYYKIAALGPGGRSGYSNVVSVETPVDPDRTLPVPMNVWAEGIAPEAVRIHWDEVTGAEYYRIHKSQNPDGIFMPIADTGPPPYIDESCNPGATYYYKVSAHNESENRHSFKSDPPASAVAGG